jgi:hypothetical protein
LIAGLSRLNLQRRLLNRGEKNIALMGIAMTLILLLCFAAAAWLTDQEDQQTAATERLNQLEAFGPVFADRCRQLIAANDLAGLRRLTTSSANKLGLREFNVSIGGGKVLANANNTATSVRQIPEHWTMEAADEAATDSAKGTRLRYPFSVPTRGGGFVEMVNSPLRRVEYSRFSSAAMVCALGLCLLVFVYRRSRRGLAEMDIVKGALAAFDQGE